MLFFLSSAYSGATGKSYCDANCHESVEFVAEIMHKKVITHNELPKCGNNKRTNMLTSKCKDAASPNARDRASRVNRVQNVSPSKFVFMYIYFYIFGDKHICNISKPIKIRHKS